MFGGEVRKYTHDSSSTKTNMVFSVFLPKESKSGPVPVLLWLSGLTCTDDNFTQKSGAQRAAADAGVALLMPDTR
jgi:S-formylglutathione hydrolase FrmB